MKVPARAHELEVFEKWAVSFHGCPCDSIPSILREGQLMRPGNKLIDGSELGNHATAGGQKRLGVYTSGSIKYAELDIYTHPSPWGNHEIRVVLQCRQNLESAKIEGETIGWKTRFGEARISEQFSNQEIERVTQSNNSIIPCRLLIGIDVITREEEEKGKREKEEKQKRKVQEDKAKRAASPVAICSVPGCSRTSWNGKLGQQCCRTCQTSGGKHHGPVCNNNAHEAYLLQVPASLDRNLRNFHLPDVFALRMLAYARLQHLSDCTADL